ncbi:hypothetical protein [Pseudoalteromonas atlantica]|uniref:hypothetical protein n=1 Tax=Pseudoalteromonas atlantica TaxID=288 RepID=UPI0037358CA8
MKYFTIIALLLSFNSFANIFEKINCGSYETTKYPNKTVFKGTVKSEVTEVGVKEFFETAQNDSKQIMWKLELLDRATGKYKKSFPRSSPYSDQKTAIEHQIIQPHVVINLGKKAITGSNNGEFGGELLLIDENDKVTLIQRMNVKDIFEMPFGLVVTSGLSHLSWNYGDIHFINSDFEIEKLYSLVGMPESSWQLASGDLLINSYPSGSQVLTKNGYMKRVQCIADKTIKLTALRTFGNDTFATIR